MPIDEDFGIEEEGDPVEALPTIWDSQTVGDHQTVDLDTVLQEDWGSVQLGSVQLTVSVADRIDDSI